MAQLPVECVGDLEMLLERLDAGTASAQDQRFAARLLRLSSPPMRHSDKGAADFRDWFIYAAVAAEIRGGLTEKAACELVARSQHLGLTTRYKFSHEGDSERPLSWQAIKGIYRRKKIESDQLDSWAV